MKRVFVAALLGMSALSVGACKTAPPPHAPPPMRPPDPPKAVVAPPPDPLGDRPEVPAGAAFVPAPPIVFDGPNGSKVWLVERHSLPLVAISVVVPYGGAAEPADAPGLAHVTADMLDEGAGTRDAVAFSSALEALGARLSTVCDRDSSVVSLEVLSAKLPDALDLMGDAIIRPKHAPKDFKRVTDLWKNDLQARGDDPNEVARIVTSAAFFGREHPYGRPLEGTEATVAKVKLPGVQAFHHQIWRPDAATFVIAGDITKEQATTLLTHAFKEWKAPKTPAGPVLAPKHEGAAPPKTVLVERADAPQIVLSIIREGVSASSADYAPLELVNDALGGSFTSRLMQNLREDHGYTYGIRSRFNLQRGAGAFVVRAAIRTDAIAPALHEALKEVTGMATDGPTVDEVGKVKSQASADAVGSYASLHAIASGLATNAGLGLPPDADAKALDAQAKATRDGLVGLAKAHLALDAATIVLVGPRAPIEEALKKEGLPAPALYDANGAPVNAAAVAKSPPAKKPLAQGFGFACLAGAGGGGGSARSSGSRPF